MESCLLAFAISIHNTPRLRSANAGIVIVAVAAYVMTQIAGILILVVACLWLYLSSPDIFSAMFAGALSPGQEFLLSSPYATRSSRRQLCFRRSSCG